MSITYERVLVTPAMAKKWLGLNSENNRKPKDMRITGYARDMQSGQWNSDSGETIKFDVNGVLIDGQNRLNAVVLADTSVEFDVARGLPESAMLVLDSGVPRSAADQLKIQGVTNRAKTATIVRWIIQWDAGNFTATSSGRGTRSTFQPTISEIISRYTQEPGLFDTAAQRADDCVRQRLGMGSAIGVAHVLFSRIAEEDTKIFFDHFVSGANLPATSPVLAVRNRMARATLERVTRPEQLALMIKAWNFFRAGTEVKRHLQLQRGDLTNAKFPQPK